MQTAIPCVLMRGGTSKGPFLHARDLPADADLRDRVLLAILGSPDARQIDGVGGGQTLSSKAAIINPSTREDADVDYLLAEIHPEAGIVDTLPSCGNLLAGVGPFSIESGLVVATDPQTTVRVFALNTASRADVTVQTPGGRVSYEGDARIDGVPGHSAPVDLRFLDPAGARTGVLFPTGNRQEVIAGLDVTCLDVAVPMVVVRARDLGLGGSEGSLELSGNPALLERLEDLRLQAAHRMGLGGTRDRAIPKLAIISPPRDGGTLTSRYFTPRRLHPAHAVTGGLCLAACALIADTVADGIADPAAATNGEVHIEHPAGRMPVQVEFEPGAGGGSKAPRIRSASTLRTARRLFQGEVLIPASVWKGNR